MARLLSVRRLWLLWGLVTLLLLGMAAAVMAYGGPRHLFLIGKTTDAHHQIELACNACHTDWFGGRESIEKSCHGCHQADLDEMNDSHPAKKFRDPRNADRLELLDATKCLTCHVEHNEDVTRPMAVTLPMDYCSACHQDVAENRPSHKGFGFETCASAGCHNFHDNQALYEDFLEKHVGDDWLSKHPFLLSRQEGSPRSPELKALYSKPAAAPAPAVPDAPAGIDFEAHVANGWLQSAHAANGVNCSGCHQPQGANPKAKSSWIEKPAMEQCAACHSYEAERFVKSKHGMRLAKDMFAERDGLLGIFKEKRLSPMRPEMARLPMKADAAHRELTCTSCHAEHDFNTARAKVEACTTCHNDEHTKAYFASPHHALWQKELAGEVPAGSGVTCASCHMPLAMRKDAKGRTVLAADHNQSGNLHPNEKMGRGVCLQCHGLGFTLDALADRALISRNFKGRPSVHVESIDWVERRMRERGDLPPSRTTTAKNGQEGD